MDASIAAEYQGAKRRPIPRHSASYHDSELARAQSVHADVEDEGDQTLRGAEQFGLDRRDSGYSDDRPVMVPLRDHDGSPSRSRPHSGIGGSRPRSQLSNSSLPGLNDEEHDAEILKNPFELPAPPMEMGSRFDPKTVEAQRRSMDLSRTASRASEDLYRDSMHSRQDSGSIDGSHRDSFYDDLENRPVYDDIPFAEQYGKPLRPPKYGQSSMAYRVHRQKLLQPRTLHMPSRLEGTERETRTVYVPDGFEIGEKPLPNEARASILNQGKGVPLSLAQRTFASSLMVGGVRDSEYFQGQAEEGEALQGITEEDRQRELAERRAPGKLYGKSLIDQLEARKDFLQNKKRVFYGDNRPNMMARQSTLIDPNALAQPSLEPGLSPPKATISSRPVTLAPGEIPDINITQDRPNDRMVKSKSVFGVDTLWEKEMAKLKNIQASEAERKAVEAERERNKESEKALRAARRFSRWNKTKTVFVENDPNHERPISWHPNMLNNPPRESESSDRPPTVNFDLDDKDLSIGEIDAPQGDRQRRPASKLDVEDWFSSDDEAPRRKSTIVATHSTAAPRLPSIRHMPSGSETSDSEDIPLSKLRVIDSDEEVPLSQIKKGVAAPTLPPVSATPATLPTFSFDQEKKEEEDKDESDDEPLFVRRSMLRPSAPEDAEDDLPLGWKHAGAAQRNSFFSPQPPFAMGMGPGSMSSLGSPLPMGMPGPMMPGPMGMPMGMGMPPMPMPMGMPMPMPPLAPGMEAPNPGKNIDDWRKQVPLAPVSTGS